jgi:hypothetical protein
MKKTSFFLAAELTPSQRIVRNVSVRTREGQHESEVLKKLSRVPE